MAEVVLTLTETGQTSGGGMQCSWGTLAADEGTYDSDGVAPTPTFASLDHIRNREPDIVLFGTEDGYLFSYFSSLVHIRAQDASATEDEALGTLTTAVAVPAAVGASQQWVAFWFSKA